jgi:hypothetical protein
MVEKHSWGLLAALLAFEAIGQSSIVVASRSDERQVFLVGLGMIWYAASGLLFYWILREGDSIVWVNLAWSVGALFIGSALAILVEGTMLSARQILALGLAAGAIILWELG